jgi:hypothetical protein
MCILPIWNPPHNKHIKRGTCLSAFLNLTVNTLIELVPYIESATSKDNARSRNIRITSVACENQL